MRLALTGGTGFVGRHLIETALGEGHSIRALARRDQPSRPNLDWIPGDLDNEAALAVLCKDADAVIHVAGVVNARDMSGFRACNVDGTRNLLKAAADVRRFVHVSSLSAREPHLSLYGASKAEGDALVMASGLDWVIVRPPAVYGPGDTETAEVYRLIARGWAIEPGGGRFSMIHVTDLARALLALAVSGRGFRQIFEIDDGTPRGLTHRMLAAHIAAALDVRPRHIGVPAAALKLGAAVDTARSRLAGRLPKLSFDRARYLAHPDWVANSDPLRNLGIWSPEIAPERGIRDTALWYREQGWL